MHPRNYLRVLVGITLAVILSGCNSFFPSATPTPLPTPTATASPPPTITASSTATVTITPLPTATPTITPTPEPWGCWNPPDDYTRLEVNGWVINARTLAMLEHAKELYGGPIDITNTAITQGSYHDNGSLSFGTHLGGGAVDLSVIKLPEWVVLWDEIEPLIRALRAAGFAAWLRGYGEVYEDSPIHIHAIAIGDAELSQAAIEQLSGPDGYFRGFNGLPGKQALDAHGGPVICQWMIEMGYGDLK